MNELCHKHPRKALSWQQSRMSACGGCRAVAPDAPDPFCPLALMFALDETCLLSGMQGQGVAISPVLKKCHIKAAEPRH